MITVIPHLSHIAIASPAAQCISHARVLRRLAAHTHRHWAGKLWSFSGDVTHYPGDVQVATNHITANRTGNERSLGRNIWLHGYCKHEQLVVKHGDVDLTLTEVRLWSSLDSCKRWFAILVRVGENCIDDLVPRANLDCLKQPFLLAHVFEHVSLQVPVDDKDCAPSCSLKSLLVSLYDLLHGVKGCLQDKDLLKVLIDHLNLLYINALDT